ncbi:MAG: ABC transporter permease [Lentisphaeria bacterium]|jgi:spermidine/putrescine transport system permease protein|nr:ABC transporter permease [Lentisphaeria bacterium]MDY0176346.1 ABC transporter permease [Lentisphaeria bacterium]
MRKSKIPAILTWSVLLFFYLPIALLVLNSFNASKTGGNWGGFTMKWYAQLFSAREIWGALKNSLLVATLATAISTLLGTCAAIALHRYKGKIQNTHYCLVYVPLVVPEILLGISLLLFFVALRIELGIVTMIIAHATFCVSYVAMAVLSRLQDFDNTILEASRDLGASNWHTTRKILLPNILPGIVAGALLAFTLSIDDFVISFFVAGPGSTTLPIQIYSMIRRGSMPLINALSTILLAITFLVILAVQLIGKSQNQQDRH